MIALHVNCLRYLLLFCVGLGLPVYLGVASEDDRNPLSTPDMIEEDIRAVPCKNEERLDAVKTLFEKMGAPAAAISIERVDQVENLSVRKEGSSQELIVVGAHYDMVPEGCGAVDNWSGIVAVAHVYRTLKDVPLNYTFALF